MAYSLYTAFNILHQKSVLLGAVLLSLKIYLTFSGGVERKRSTGFHLQFIQVQQELVSCRVNSI